MVRTPLERPAFRIEERFDVPKEKKDEREFEIAGTVTCIDIMQPDFSVVTLATMDKDPVVLKNNKPKHYWLKATQMGKKVIIKGRHPMRPKDLVQILLVRNCAEMEHLSGYANGNPEKYEQGKKALEAINESYREVLTEMAIEAKNGICSKASNRSSVTANHNEMLSKFIYLYEFYPPEQRGCIENYLRAYDRASREDKERFDKRLGLLIHFIPGLHADTLGVDIEKVSAMLDGTFPGQRGIKKGLYKCLLNYQLDPRHMGPRILIKAPKKYDIHRLITAFFSEIKMTCTCFSCAGLSDNANLVGSSAIYSNSSLGGFAESLQINGSGGMFFKDVDLASKQESLLPIQGILDGFYSNELMQSPLDVRGEWIVMTCSDADKIPFDVSAGVTVLEAEDYTEGDMLGQVKGVIREFSLERLLPEKKFLLSETVRKGLATKYTGKNNVCELRANVNDVLQNALFLNRNNKGQIRINEENFSRYFSLLGEADHLKNDHLSGVNEIKRKMMLFGDCIQKGIVDRVLQYIDELEITKDEDKRKLLTRKIIELGNVKLIKPINVDFERVKESLKELYGLDETKERLQDYLYSVTGRENFRFQPILLYGPMGVGKTTLANAIAKALSMETITFAFNQMSDPKDLTGYPDFFKSTKKGLLGRMLEVRTDSACVIVDEVDKPLVKGMHDALHNILDRQDATDQEYELSYNTDRILFILTANDLGAIPATIRDRCELIKVEPYSIRERMEMAREVLLPKAVMALGIQKNLVFEDDMLHLLLSAYTTTGGVRETEVAIDRILKRMVRTRTDYVVTKDLIEESLGVPLTGKRSGDKDKDTCGVAKALAVTGSGGTLFNITTCRNPFGSETVTITGLAKNSFLESVSVAISIASRLMCERLGPGLEIHCTDAGIEKDGPSAGLTLTCSILSLLTGISLQNVAFTGEVDINGSVLPIGGLKHKLTAAERHLIEKVYVPKANYDQLAAERSIEIFDLEIVPVESVSELIFILFPEYVFPGML